jgi:hypothetical protein
LNFSFPSVFPLALGKDLVRRVQKKLRKHVSLPNAKKTLGKQASLPSAKKIHSENKLVGRVFSLSCVRGRFADCTLRSTRQSQFLQTVFYFPSVVFVELGKALTDDEQSKEEDDKRVIRCNFIFYRSFCQVVLLYYQFFQLI